MKVFFVGGVFNNFKLDKVINNSKGVIQFAADTLQKCFIEGLISTGQDISIFSLPFIGSYPQRYKLLYTDFENFEFNGKKVKSINFLNLIAIKFISRWFNLFTSLIKDIKLSSKITIVIYSLHLPFLLGAVNLKWIFSNIRIVVIVPDLPEFMSAESSYLRIIMLRIQRFILKFLYKHIDGFVVLTKYMPEFLNIPIDKAIVIEGIYSANHIQNPNSFNLNKDVINVLYSGVLDSRYGILDLINQFSKLEVSEYSLIICGAGNCEKEIIEKAQLNKNIFFLGQLSRENVIGLQMECDILVNPRRPEKFTKYSFPSKTMEYLGSGVPTILYKLEGIPEEYYDYCLVCDENLEYDLMKKILYLGSLSKEERYRIGERAKKFIEKEKNPIRQVKRLNLLIKNIWEC